MYILKTTIEDAAQIAKVQVDSWQSTYKGIVPEEFLNQMNYDLYTDRFKKYFRERKPVSYVAIANDDIIVGYVTAGENRLDDKLFKAYDCELHAIYILKTYQGKQLGKKLIKACINELLERNHQKMLVQVLSDNPATKFYEKLGGRYLESKQLMVHDDSLEEAIYGWNNISMI
ncbi:GNAT family N-acetyltransferase [Marinilactibacillus kalidii]|uniref:GNAT family N-acetyltransferase n=1 Tax=Marinilactibacillus kalidii TaxID=2820274 RepID=UPI001ABDFE57|nr:GNAT family N-acetyltransferase [Marinilactibacillus kalidii]